MTQNILKQNKGRNLILEYLDAFFSGLKISMCIRLPKDIFGIC